MKQQHIIKFIVSVFCLIFTLAVSANATAAILQFTATNSIYGELGYFTLDESAFDSTPTQSVSNTNILALNFIDPLIGETFGTDDIFRPGTMWFELNNGTPEIAWSLSSFLAVNENAVFLEVVGLHDVIMGAGYEVQWDTSTVPVPAAVWLFGSGLLGLVGFAKRKKS